jgi:hypothetical protein
MPPRARSRCQRRRQHDVGRGLSAQRVDVSPIVKDPGGDARRVPEHKQAKIAGGNTARVYNFYVAKLTVTA